MSASLGMNIANDDASHLPVRTVDTRTAKRASTVLLIGRVCHHDTESPCLVLNISETGMMLRLTFAAQAGDRIEVETRGLAPCEATVRWVNGSKAGIEFDDRQDITVVLSPETHDGIVARTPRFDVALKVRISFPGHGFFGDVVNISPGGAKLATTEQVEIGQIGQIGQIFLPGRDLGIYGTVRWARDGQFGFQFSSALPLSMLHECLTKGFAGRSRPQMSGGNGQVVSFQQPNA